jgi:hypothetical protein
VASRRPATGARRGVHVTLWRSMAERRY